MVSHRRRSDCGRRCDRRGPEDPSPRCSPRNEPRLNFMSHLSGVASNAARAGLISLQARVTVLGHSQDHALATGRCRKLRCEPGERPTIEATSPTG